MYYFLVDQMRAEASYEKSFMSLSLISLFEPVSRVCIICLMCFFTVLKIVLSFCVQLSYRVFSELGSFMNSFFTEMPLFAIWIDLSTGAQDALIADLHGFRM